MDGKVNIHDLIEEWNREPVAEPLHAYLGLTPEQYKRWVETGDVPHGSHLYNAEHDGSGTAREDDRRRRAKARRRALNRLAGRHRDEYLRILNEEVKRLRGEENGEDR